MTALMPARRAAKVVADAARALAGRLPFEADNPLKEALARLTEKPRPLRTFVSGLDPRVAAYTAAEDRTWDLASMLEGLDLG